jgi:large subunit ribosomal protein L14e
LKSEESFSSQVDLRTASWLLSLRSSITSAYVALPGIYRPKSEVLTHLQALVDGPSTDTKTAVPRQSVALANVILTPLILEKLPRGARTGVVKAQWEKAGIEAKWQESAWAKKRQQKERRRALTDFERFKVLRLRKQARFEVRKSLAKVKASA